jgi:cell division protein ZapA
MADVRLSIAGREYLLTCNDGEEAHLKALGTIVDEKAREAGGSSGGLNESRLLLFAALLLADKLNDLAGAAADISSSQTTNVSIDQATETLERLADRLENLALRLEN